MRYIPGFYPFCQSRCLPFAFFGQTIQFVIRITVTDKNKFAEIFEEHKINIVIHAGCTVDNDFGPIITEKEMKISHNCDRFIYRYAMDAGVEKFVLISTAQVYEYPKT